MARLDPKPNSAQKGKQKRDAAATKARILEAATEEFAKYGLAGARTAAIATQSQVTKALLCYYFTNKETLYRSVLQRLVSDINAAFQPTDWDMQTPAQALASMIRAYIAFEAQNRWHGMLWFQEAIQNQGRYGEETGWQAGFQSMVSVLEQGMAIGQFRPLDPFLTAINILGVCSFYFDAHENLKYLDSQQQLLSPEMVERQTEEVVRLVLAGVSAGPEV
ncbi:TetR/AcrR family transcriptional regulator [Acaryochloris sp. 'Moss Beach']|uniref:TetR/AcrR family transcriptional regulator n=1 Tax=Acaryochloris sp. 'Moss Beach' TaxID=2740837 RepID=UPI001F4817A1|nr:TetR/AcrR family transcriptional regulator [Acaryochloris sp. 'Moss Beach']UJB67641.1 TetR/AcrR family transcriptional regulator [Acaryochloris sp. 'Moss Beach']